MLCKEVINRSYQLNKRPCSWRKTERKWCRYSPLPYTHTLDLINKHLKTVLKYWSSSEDSRPFFPTYTVSSLTFHCYSSTIDHENLFAHKIKASTYKNFLIKISVFCYHRNSVIFFWCSFFLQLSHFFNFDLQSLG